MLEKYLAFYLLDIGVKVADNETKKLLHKIWRWGRYSFQTPRGIYENFYKFPSVQSC